MTQKQYATCLRRANNSWVSFFAGGLQLHQTGIILFRTVHSTRERQAVESGQLTTFVITTQIVVDVVNSATHQEKPPPVNPYPGNGRVRDDSRPAASNYDRETSI